MPTILPNGITVFNVTPHELRFWFDKEGVEVVAPSDMVISAMPVSRMVKKTDQYSLHRLTYHETQDGREKIRKIREEHPDALIVGSVIAAQGFPGEVVACVTNKTSRLQKFNKQVRPDRFTFFEEK